MIEDFVKDVDTATSSVVEDLQEAVKGGQTLAASQEARVGISRAAVLKRELDNLVLREMIQRPQTISSSRDVKQEEPEEEDVKDNVDTLDDNVLTLLGNVGSNQHPKHLFTSTLKPGTLKRPLGELALPNGIIATKIVPKHSLNDLDDSKPAPTLGEVFAPPLTLPALNPPKQSRHTATRSSSVNWYNPAEAESKNRSSRRDGYATQPLSTGQWLTYNVAPSPAQLASPETKRKQRDRALSFGEPQPSVSQESTVAHHQAKEDALFRSVYSSFAPDRDDSLAMVAEQQKNRLWWRKYGESKYLYLLDLRDLGHAIESDGNGFIDGDEVTDEEIKEAVDAWIPEDPPEEMKVSKPVGNESPKTSKEADDLLQEISELLETLNSHQRVRNLTMPTNSRSLTGQTPQLTGISGSPSSPSAAEFDVYELLKNQLAMIVSNLPPYLLAKLDGEKLGALNISTRIQVESKYQNGNLAEDSALSAPKVSNRGGSTTNASQAASSYANLPARSSSYYQSSATPAQQYQRSGYASQPAVPRQPSGSIPYLQNQQYSNRPASYNYASTNPRPPYPAQAAYTPQRAPASSTDRFSSAQQYGQQQSQSSYGAYQNGYRPYANQNVSNYNYNQQYSTPQARPSSNPVQAPQAYRGSQSEHPQRAVPPSGYGYGSAQVGGSASPQQRSSFSGQGQDSSQQRPQLYHQHSSQYKPQTPTSPLVNGNGASGQGAQQSQMTADEQATVMNRQKAQLAERQGSGTPQPAAGHYGQQNGTPATQQSGITAGQG